MRTGEHGKGKSAHGKGALTFFIHIQSNFSEDLAAMTKNELKHRNSCIFKNLSIIIKSCKILTVLKENLINTIPCQYSEFVLAEVHTKAASCRKRTLFRSRTASLIAQSISIGWLFRPG